MVGLNLTSSVMDSLAVRYKKGRSGKISGLVLISWDSL